MNLVERYIFRISAGAFAACLLALTGVIWLTQALRQLDVVTAQGQTILVFLTVTGLTIPTLLAVIAPVALFIATLYGLNRLNSDSELIVMSAAGLSPVRLLRPFLTLGGLVSGLVALLTIAIIPSSFQEIRDLVTRIRADFVANIAQEGQFTTLDNGITFHYRERGPGASCSASSSRTGATKPDPRSTSPNAAARSSRTAARSWFWRTAACTSSAGRRWMPRSCNSSGMPSTSPPSARRRAT